MSPIDRDAYRQKSDQITADDIEDVAVVTIKEVVEDERKDKSGRFALVKTEEIAGKVLFLTDVAIDALIAHYGDNSFQDFVGKSLPLEQYDKRDESKGVRVPPTEAWEEVFNDAGVKYPGLPGASAARPATRAASTTPKVGKRATPSRKR